VVLAQEVPLVLREHEPVSVPAALSQVPATQV